jgi:hypothetical protein
MMRKSLISLVTALSMLFAMPAVSIAQVGKSASLFGQIVDATGRGAAGKTVELVSEGVVVGMTTSSADGHFTFAVGSSGSYVVRTIVNGHPAGIRVAVTSGKNPPMALLVLPTFATSSPQIGVLISGGINGLIAAGTIVASTVTSSLVTLVSEKKDEEILADPETKAQAQAALIQVIAQITNQTPQQVQQQVVNNGGTLPAGLPGVPAGLVTAVNAIITNTPVGSGN